MFLSKKDTHPVPRPPRPPGHASIISGVADIYCSRGRAAKSPASLLERPGSAAVLSRFRTPYFLLILKPGAWISSAAR